MQLQLETTNVCNADCVFCEYGKMSRPKGLMKMPLFFKIIEEAATIPQIELVTLTGLGEPLLDRHIVERLAWIHTKMPGVKTDLYTNGTFLTPSMSDKLFQIGHIGTVFVSLNATNREKRQEIMQLDDYDKVVEHIRYAQSKRYNVIIKGVISKDLMEAGDQEKFMLQWGPPTSMGGKSFLHLEGNWAGGVWNMRTKMKQACSRALGQIMVLWDGRVSLCCFDGDGRDILGDLNTQTIREMYNGGRALFVREAHNEGRRSEIALCANCTGI